MKTKEEILSKSDFHTQFTNDDTTTHHIVDYEDAVQAMEEYAEQQAIDFVAWANKNCWYKHYDQNDNCWTSRDEKRTETTENLYKEFKNAG